MIWFLAYIAASPQLAYAFVAPDCIDHTADRVRGGHRRRRKGTYNIADFADPLTAPGKGEKWIGYSLLKYAQHVGFWLTLIDATLDWTILGTSFAYQWSGCSDPNQGWAQCKIEGGIPALFPAQTLKINIWTPVGSNIYRTSPVGILVPRGHAAGCGFSLKSYPDPFPPLPEATWTATLLDVESGRNYGIQEPTLQPDGSRTLMFAAPVTNNADDGGNFQVVLTKSDGVLKMDGNMSASGANLEGITKSACGKGIPGF